MQLEGRRRVVVQNVRPQIDCGEFSVKRAVGEIVEVRANVFCDGHDEVAAALLYKVENEENWHKIPMKHLGNDLWQAEFIAAEECRYFYTVQGWIDHFFTWRMDLRKKKAAGQALDVELQMGAELVENAAEQATGDDASRLLKIAHTFKDKDMLETALTLALGEDLRNLMDKYAETPFVTLYEKELTVEVERRRAGFSSWYEFFPRSFGKKPGEHGTFRECEKQLPRIAEMGFDVVYLTPIHPIGDTNRKGKNNAVTADTGDPGSPWAIGSKDGGHKDIHPDLGTLDDFRAFIKKAQSFNIAVAIDIAYQCSPDHPYVKDHPEWFKWRPDGSIQFAENPPKKYEDVVPFNFECEDWRNLWKELKSVFTYWAEQGVRIFRVDNPHTKPFSFWQWLISEVKSEYPDTIFLAEAFTRPQVMGRLAKIGFTQSYTYFTWRNNKYELTQYMNQLVDSELSEYMRPNFWPNTPDILPQFLQYGGRPAFLIRLALAATLSSNYGIYGPAFELLVGDAIEGREEYLNSEKYEIKDWDLNKKGNISQMIAMINRIRNENDALQQTRNLRFYDVDNEYILFYGKASRDYSNVILVLVNLDPFHKQSGWVHLPLEEFDIDPNQPYMLHDMIGDDRFIWQGSRNYVELNPGVLPFHIFKLHRRMRREQDFDYYM